MIFIALDKIQAHVYLIGFREGRESLFLIWRVKIWVFTQRGG